MRSSQERGQLAHEPLGCVRAHRLSFELNEAADFYDLERPGLGTEFLDAVEAALIVVADTPAAFPIELGETRKRVISRFPYSIMYWFDDATVHVSAIAHHRQRPRYWGDRP